MSAILNSLNAHNLLIFQPILMILVSKFMIYRVLSDKTYLSLGLLSPLRTKQTNKQYQWYLKWSPFIALPLGLHYNHYAGRSVRPFMVVGKMLITGRAHCCQLIALVT